MITTKAQRQTLHHYFTRRGQAHAHLTYRQWRKLAQPELCGDGAIMILWCGMWIGIERDGYAHS